MGDGEGEGGVIYVSEVKGPLWVAETLEELKRVQPIVDLECPHCSAKVRAPVCVRSEDLRAFETLMRSAERVMRRHGITANLGVDIQAECLIQIAKRRA